MSRIEALGIPGSREERRNHADCSAALIKPALITHTPFGIQDGPTFRLGQHGKTHRFLSPIIGLLFDKTYTSAWYTSCTAGLGAGALHRAV